MFKSYDTTEQAFTEHTPKIYSDSEGAWIEAPSAKTYDTTEQAWVERMVSDWFAVTTKTIYTGDIVELSATRLYFDNVGIAKYPAYSRNLILRADHALKKGDVIEFDCTINYGGQFAVSSVATTSSGGTNYSTLWSKSSKTTALENEHITITIDAVESDYTYKYIQIATGYSYDNGSFEATCEVSNFKINGKKYGFTK